jgi:hypothetical protein
MPILNYTTSISAQKTVAEIQSILQKSKASSVLTEYDPEGVLSAVSFRINLAHGLLSFRLPANIESVYKVLVKDGRVPRSLRTKEQASKVAWRIVKDWLAAQLAFIESQQAEFEQVFLPYAQNQSGQTVFEAYREKKFSQLALTDSNYARKPNNSVS